MDAMKLSGQKQQIKLNLRDLDAPPKPDGKLKFDPLNTHKTHLICEVLSKFLRLHKIYPILKFQVAQKRKMYPQP
jgi:hypothetical protein